MEYNQELTHYGVLGMKWGRRRTDAQLAAARNKSTAKNMSDEELTAQVKRMTLENTYNKLNKNGQGSTKLDKTKKVIDTANSAVNQLGKISNDSNPKPQKKKMNLDNMTDKELRDRINRTNLEKQYTDMFGETEQVTISKGKKFLNNTLEVAGSTLAIGSSALAIALAIKELKN